MSQTVTDLDSPPATGAPPAPSETEDAETLARGLRGRHLNMIAIGGAIGTGLFVASGDSISTAGPGGALVAYACMGVMVFLLMQSLGEMATWLPVSGSFEAYGTRYVSRSFGFAAGWNYWFNWAITVAVELSAAAIVMRYWFPNSPGALWSGSFLLILFLVNALTVNAFGETEFWFASVKVLAVIAFLLTGILMLTGVLGGPSVGFKNWTTGSAPFVHGWHGILSIFMVAGFSFQGTELIAVAAGEAAEPEKTIPRAIRSVFLRIVLFYIGAIVVIGFLVPYTDPRLLGGAISNVAVSPFTIVFERAGIQGAATILNCVILTSILSAGNSGMFAATRMLYGMAQSGNAPRIFGRTNRHGVPIPALLATAAVGAACFISSLLGDGAAYVWLVNASGLAGFITWMGIAWCHYRFRAAFVRQGHQLRELPFQARWFPAGPIVALTLCALIILGQNYQALFGHADVRGLLASYVGIPFFVVLWASHKVATRSAGTKLDHVDLSR